MVPGNSVAPRAWWMGRINVHPATLVMMRGMASVHRTPRKEKGWEKVLVSFIMDLKERCQEVLLPRGTNGDPDGNLTRY